MIIQKYRGTLVRLHRWMGLGAAVFLAIIGVSGAAFLIPAFRSSRPFLEKFHTSLLIPGGKQFVIAVTVVAVLLQLSGLYLWWRQKRWTIRWGRGWRSLVNDIHHASGVALFALMLLLAATGLGRIVMRQFFREGTFIMKGMNGMHTGLLFPTPVQWLYIAGGVAFLLQGLTGVMMWWSARRAKSATFGGI